MKIQSSKKFGVASLKILVFGPSGIGKTTLAKTIKEPTLIISAEAGLLSISDTDIDVVDITMDDKGALVPRTERFAALIDVYRYLQTEEAKKAYKWIFIDSLSEISSNLIEALNKEFPERKDALKLYGDNAKRMRNLIRSFRDLPDYNVVFTALSVDDKDESGKRFTGIDIAGKMSQQVHGFFDEVFYMMPQRLEDGTVARVLQTQPTDSVVCKDRSGKLDRLEAPDLSVIATKIKGAK